MRPQRRREILFFIFSSLLSGVLLHLLLDLYESPAIQFGILPDHIGGVPVKIVKDAISNGGVAVHLYGTSEEKHAFAKGRPTRFGRMPYATDSHLQRMGWSEKKIHDVGYRHGYSELWNPNKK